MVLPSNPIPALLAALSEDEVILDPQLLDTLRLVITSVTKARDVSDQYILLLLAHLSDIGLVALSKVNYISNPGLIYFIKKEKLDGN